MNLERLRLQFHQVLKHSSEGNEMVQTTGNEMVQTCSNSRCILWENIPPQSNYQMLSIFINYNMWETLWQPLTTFSKDGENIWENNLLHSVAKRVIGAKHLLCVSILALKTPNLLGAFGFGLFKHPKGWGL